MLGGRDMFIFFIIITALIPLTIIGIGLIWRKRPPAKISMLYGYRTTRSMQNKETWDFAHHYIAKAWPLFGIILLPLSLPWPILFRNCGEDMLGTLVLIIVGVQMAAGLILPIVLTERALKGRFDEYGRLRK
jgi:uncharacterized membrane protein